MKKIVTHTEQVIDCYDFSQLVTSTYGRPYCFQQQDGCKDRGRVYVEVPSEGEDYENHTVVEKVNGPEFGVSFEAWLERDPKQPLSTDQNSYSLELWWKRNFYPNVDMVLNDLHERGLIDEGQYSINIDW